MGCCPTLFLPKWGGRGPEEVKEVTPIVEVTGVWKLLD